MLSTLSSKVLDAMNGAVVYICGISTTTSCHYTVFHGLNPIFRWLYDTIFICSKNKNQAKNYYGTCEKKFKERYSNHTVSFRDKSKEKSTELSKYIWELKNSSINYDLNWSIAYKSHPCLNLIYV